jgi:citrate synthase
MRQDEPGSNVTQDLSAAEAAARLGVKRDTLYAYVSRGMVSRRVSSDGRTSRFDADEIDQLRRGRRRRATGEVDALLSTALTSVSDQILLLRGHDLIELVAGGATFETVVEVLWDTGPAPWVSNPGLLTVSQRVQDALPETAELLERLRVTVAVAGADPLRHDLSDSGVIGAGRSLLALMIDSLPVGATTTPGRHTPMAERLWARLGSDPGTPAQLRALDVALALLVDHGLAVSTFGARLAASVRADPYSVVAAGLGVIGGVLHGAASSQVHELLDRAATVGAVTAVGEGHRRGGPTPGFGHVIYRHHDPRQVLLDQVLREAWVDDPRLTVLDDVVEAVRSRSEVVANVDLALGALTWLAGWPGEAGEAIFAVSRTGGWLAHALEEYREQPLRFRPRARYVGPPLGSSPPGGGTGHEA